MLARVMIFTSYMVVQKYDTKNLYEFLKELSKSILIILGSQVTGEAK